MQIKELKQLIRGDRLKLSNKYVNFCDNDAWDMTVIRGVISTKKYAEDYFLMKAIGQGLPYTLTFVSFAQDVGGETNKDVPGAFVEARVGDITNSFYIKHTDINRAA